MKFQSGGSVYEVIDRTGFVRIAEIDVLVRDLAFGIAKESEDFDREGALKLVLRSVLANIELAEIDKGLIELAREAWQDAQNMEDEGTGLTDPESNFEKGDD
jgi:hypothetical protein